MHPQPTAAELARWRERPSRTQRLFGITDTAPAHCCWVRSVPWLIPQDLDAMISLYDSDPRIGDLYTTWADAFRRQDVAVILSLLSPDYVLWAPGAPPVDRDGLRTMLSAAFSTYDITSAFECEERLVSGDLAFDRGWDIQTIKSQTAGETRSQRQRVFLLLRRSSDGRWQFARGMSQPGPLP